MGLPAHRLLVGVGVCHSEWFFQSFFHLSFYDNQSQASLIMDIIFSICFKNLL